MASPPRRLALLHLPLLLVLLPLIAAADPVLEDGYAVSTFADLNPLPASGPQPHPYAILLRPRAGDLVLLDSTGSAIYALPLSPGGGGEPRRLAGGKRAGLDRPRSVAVDGADNVYVADRIHGAVRKVAPSGYITTIAGGLSSGSGHRDGPAQNATFSSDFELTYVPKICALLVADRGNRLIRQINLKPEECAHEAQPGLGTTSVSVIAILSALLGSVVGFLVRHFYPVHEVSINRFSSRVQKKYVRTQRKATLISFCDIKSAVANSSVYTLLLKLVRVSRGYLTVVFPSVRLEQLKPSRLDLRKTGTASNSLRNRAPRAPTEQLGDLISFAGDASDKEDNGNANNQEGKEPSLDSELMGLLCTPQGSVKKIDNMIEANLSGFLVQEDRRSFTISNCSVSRRTLHGDK